MNPIWKTYKNKMMKTLNANTAEEAAEESNEVETERTPVQEDEGSGAVTQLAKRMQGVGAKGWKSMSALFNKDDEHQLLEAETQPAADHPLAVKPEEMQPSKRNTGFWDSFATKWQQAASTRQAEAGGEEGQGAKGEGEGGEGQSQERETQEEEESGGGVEGGGGSSKNSFSKYAAFGGGGEDTAFKWNFVTSKLADLKSRSLAKTN